MLNSKPWRPAQQREGTPRGRTVTSGPCSDAGNVNSLHGIPQNFRGLAFFFLFQRIASKDKY